MLLDSGVSTAANSASLTTMTTTTSGVTEWCVPDAAAVVASLCSKLVHCVDEQRNIEHLRSEDFADWFQQLVASPDFVDSIDRWT